MAIIGKGTTLGHCTTQSGTYTLVANITKVKVPKTSSGNAESTCFGDSSEQFVPGWLNGGKGSFTVNYGEAQTSVLYPLVGTMLWFQITLPDTHTWTFQGFIDGYEPDDPLKKVITEDITIMVNGVPIYA